MIASTSSNYFTHLACDSFAQRFSQLRGNLPVTILCVE